MPHDGPICPRCRGHRVEGVRAVERKVTRKKPRLALRACIARCRDCGHQWESESKSLLAPFRK